MVRGRFAPSPTGLLHIGGARTALVAWLAARAAGGTFLLRLEDLDRPRVVPGADEAIIDDLRWLGLDWDEPPHYQSQRQALYQATLARLELDGLVFPCRCSRADIVRAASAPHALSEEGPRYPGTCRERSPSARPASIRFRVEPGLVCFDDAIAGQYCQDVSLATGDFVLRRADGIYAYQLAVVADDLAMGIDQVVRGDDLLSSTPRQLLLYQALGAVPPAFAHVPLILGPDRQRLSKRHGAIAIRDLRAAGISAARVVGRLAASLGLGGHDGQAWPAELVAGFSLAKVPRQPALLDAVSFAA